MSPRLSSAIFTATVFCLCLWAGCQLALRKPLWNDELYTQVRTIEPSSWIDIARGYVPEGSKAPLYYLLQKAVESVADYRLPFMWQETSDGKVYDLRSQILLRLVSNVCMSLGLALMAGYFWVYYSPLAGLLALLTGLSSYTVLAYWAEARPYALWFLLSTLQLVYFLRCFQSSKSRDLKILGVIHWLLAFTIIISAGQIALVSALLWLKGHRNKKQYIGLAALPIMICAYFLQVTFPHALIYPYRVQRPWDLIGQVFALDQMLLLLILAAIYWVFARGDRYRINPAWKSRINLAVYAIGSLIFAGLLLFYYKLKEIPGVLTAPLDSRCLVFLAPVAILAVVSFIVDMFRFLRHNCSCFWLWQYILLVFLFYVVHVLLVYQDVYSRALFAY